MQNASTFQVYNASAGSGKTFTLVKEYIKVLLQSDDVYKFQKVLAITFTNKAASEMKERVLKNLDAFSKGIQSVMYSKIIEETSLDKGVLKERSIKVLDAILQNYSAFSITTIDSFTHKIIKSFAFDLGLSQNFEVEMDPSLILDEAVDMLISKIGTNQALTDILIDFSIKKIDQDKSWDISYELKEVSKILLNEDDIEHFRRLSNKTLDDFSNLNKKVLSINKEVIIKLKNLGKEALTIINDTGLEPQDFTRGTLPKFFNDVSLWLSGFDFYKRSITIEKAIENHKFYNKTANEFVVSSIEGILPKLIQIFDELKIQFGYFVISDLVLKNIIPLAVLNKINTELNQIKKDNNIRLNAEFNQLISDHIKDEPAPYIYERIGSRFMHYFIDEMQDTSVLQWKNLIPLIDNALSQIGSNLLLVGDGKQAIYRWRGGKAEQFINLSIDNDNGTNPFVLTKELKKLNVNYRSYSEVIKFNNHFFKNTANFFKNKKYRSLFEQGNDQQENNKKGGFVSITFLKKEQKKDQEKIKYAKSVLHKINDLKDQFNLNEICVLVRKRKEGVIIANYLSENDINIISSDTLLLQNSKKVKFIVNLLQIIQYPNDQESRFELLYFLHGHLKITELISEFLQKNIVGTNRSVFNKLKEYGSKFDIKNFNELYFYDKIESIIRGFNLMPTSDAYIQFFLDVVLERQRKVTSILDFLDFWKIKKDKLSIVSPDDSDAVKVMTIHKSKGLEFPVVIFPCDLYIYYQIKPKVWFDKLPQNYLNFKELLINYSSKLSYINDRGDEIFRKVREKLELDNLNLLYVALTRPIEQLYVITEKKNIKNVVEKNNYYSTIFVSFLKKINLWNDNKSEYFFGSKYRNSKKKSNDLSCVVQQSFISTPWQKHNLKLLASSSKLWDTNQVKSIEYGNLVHDMLSKIYTSYDVDNVINQYLIQGEFSIDIKNKIYSNIKNVVSHHLLKGYFTKKINVFNERELITKTNTILIPDKLIFDKKSVTIIDYKTGKPHKKHHKQIESYSDVLVSMGFVVIKKILVYINDEVFVEQIK